MKNLLFVFFVCFLGAITECSAQYTLYGRPVTDNNGVVTCGTSSGVCKDQWEQQEALEEYDLTLADDEILVELYDKERTRFVADKDFQVIERPEGTAYYYSNIKSLKN